ncbi:MAG: OsmC family protein [Myxococcota bacterium]
MILELDGPTDLRIRELAEPGLRLHGDAGGEGFGPLQMLAASLGLCTAAVLDGYARGVLDKDVGRLELRVRWDYADRPTRVGSFRMDVHWPDVPADRVEAVRRAVRSCTVHRTLEHPPEVRTEIHR